MPEQSERRPPAVGDLVHFVFEYRPRVGTVIALGARPGPDGVMPSADPDSFVQVSTADTDPPALAGMFPWNIPISMIDRDAPTLVKLFEVYAEHKHFTCGLRANGYDRLMATAAREELDRRIALLLRDPAAPMTLEHLNGTKRSAMREYNLAMVDAIRWTEQKEEGHDA